MNILQIKYVKFDAVKYACENWHYSRCSPSGKLYKLGVYEDNKFIGVVVFGRGAAPRMSMKYGLRHDECCELVRVALKKHNTYISKILSICIKKLKKDFPKIKLIVSFADPFYNHIGAIYQASNFIYFGTTKIRERYIINGKFIHPRSISSKGIKQNIKEIQKRYPNAKEIKVPGKHIYLYFLDNNMKKKYLILKKEYPKRLK